ncbi:MAG: FAD:protein FMN transferase, partial [Paracoccaceae bacterium]
MFGFLSRKKEAPQPPAKPAGRFTLFHIAGETMGTRYTVSFATSGEPDQDRLKADVHQAVDLVDRQMSTWKPDSPLSQFNRSTPGDWFSVPAELAHVVDTGLRISRSTQGAFDMTVGSAVNLWGFGPDGGRQDVPTQPEADAAGGSCGYGMLEVRHDPPALRKAGECSVDLSGIAKGYGVDRIAETLEASGVTDYLVAIDGELRLRGRKPGNEPRWAVSVDAPVHGQKQTWDILLPPDGALATSGDYRRVFSDGGKAYAHSIDPATGRPVDNDIASVTVFHRDCMMADAWATALLVKGSHAGVVL